MVTRWMLSIQEHPFLNRPWYKLHPCGTSDWMKLLCLGDEVAAKNGLAIELYLVSWFSVVGQVVGLKTPLEMVKKSVWSRRQCFGQKNEHIRKRQGSILDPILTIPMSQVRLFFVFLFHSLNSLSMILEIVSYCISVLYPFDFHKIWINNPHLVCISWWLLYGWLKDGRPVNLNS